MSLLSSIPIIGKIFDKTVDIIDKVVSDKDLATKIKGELASADFSLLSKELDAQTLTLAAELAGTGIQRSWRPHLMYLMMFFLVWIIVIVPLFGIAGIEIPVKESLENVPDQMWTMLTVGLGGYTVFRSGEKMVSAWAKKSNG